jgi:hypothetical protein
LSQKTEVKMKGMNIIQKIHEELSKNGVDKLTAAQMG